MVTDTGSDYEHVEEHDWMLSLTDPPARAGEVLAHGAALAVRGHDLLTVGHGFTLHVIAHGDAGVTDAHAARLWFPDVVVLVDFSLHGAAVFWRLNWTQTHTWSVSRAEQQKASTFTLTSRLPAVGPSLGVAAEAAVKHTGQHSPSGVTVSWQGPRSSHTTSSHTAFPMSHTQIRHGSGFHMSLLLWTFPFSVQVSAGNRK